MVVKDYIKAAFITVLMLSIISTYYYLEYFKIKSYNGLKSDTRAVNALDGYYYYGTLEDGKRVSGAFVSNCLARSIYEYKDGAEIVVETKAGAVTSADFRSYSEDERRSILNQIILTKPPASADIELPNTPTEAAKEKFYIVSVVNSTQRNGVIVKYLFKEV